MSERADFKWWESEMKTDEIMPVQRSITYAQELQTYLSTLPWEQQQDAWIEALLLLREVKYDLREMQQLVHTVRAFAYFEDSRDSAGEVPILEFGEMYVTGSVGGYSYATYENFPSIMLNLYEPKQQRVWAPEDVMEFRLPVPLSIPVMCVESLIAWKK